LSIPDIGNVGGVEITCIIFVELTTPQLLVIVYETVAVPTATPVTTPLALIDAKLAELMLQDPAGIEFERVIDEPTQTLDAPAMVSTTGSGFIFIFLVTTVEPQAFVVTQEIVVVPAVIAVT
jgi:hypothetical protein